VLHEADSFAFKRPNNLPPDRVRQEAQSYFDGWFSTASEFFAAGASHRARSSPRLVAFNRHQATERYYHRVLLTRSHELTVLRSHCQRIEQRLIAAWPRATRFERRGAGLLRHAYVSAGYAPDCQVGDDELDWRMDQVCVLQAIVARSAWSTTSSLADQNDGRRHAMGTNRPAKSADSAFPFFGTRLPAATLVIGRAPLER